MLRPPSTSTTEQGGGTTTRSASFEHARPRALFTLPPLTPHILAQSTLADSDLHQGRGAAVASSVAHPIRASRRRVPAIPALRVITQRATPVSTATTSTDDVKPPSKKRKDVEVAAEGNARAMQGLGTREGSAHARACRPRSQKQKETRWARPQRYHRGRGRKVCRSIPRLASTLATTCSTLILNRGGPKLALRPRPIGTPLRSHAYTRLGLDRRGPNANAPCPPRASQRSVPPHTLAQRALWPRSPSGTPRRGPILRRASHPRPAADRHHVVHPPVRCTHASEAARRGAGARHSGSTSTATFLPCRPQSR
ncbi:hypothetical protein DFH09DRAFT_1508753 [Mycena vulgaris]|nr:hypothetical protein DFH09DRAFT_1508753 [Mycena vulgaris]